MKRLIKKSYQQDFTPQIGDSVSWKKHPYDFSVYEVKEVLPNGNIFMDNGVNAYTDIKPSVLKKIEKPAE
jgi:hypothetical protein